MPPVLVTGAAGFIGYHLARRLLEDGHAVVGLDNMNAYYSVALKEARLAELEPFSGFSFAPMDLQDGEGLASLFDAHGFKRVVNLAAQAGVRHSITHPHPYVGSNVAGFLNLLECCRHHQVEHLIYASSSSVYGATASYPFSEHLMADHPVSLYAATKRANELMAHAYSHLYAIPTTGCRFFTVYGEWGRPDMALYSFAEAMYAGRPIKLFNHGDMQRDFTYVGDVVESVARLLDIPPRGEPGWDPKDPDPASSRAPFAIYNVGRGGPVALLDFVRALERSMGIEAIKELVPMQPGDVHVTWADTHDLEAVVGYRPTTSVEDSVAAFVRWFLDYKRREGPTRE